MPENGTFAGAEESSIIGSPAVKEVDVRINGIAANGKIGRPVLVQEVIVRKADTGVKWGFVTGSSRC